MVNPTFKNPFLFLPSFLLGLGSQHFFPDRPQDQYSPSGPSPPLFKGKHQLSALASWHKREYKLCSNHVPQEPAAGIAPPPNTVSACQWFPNKWLGGDLCLPGQPLCIHSRLLEAWFLHSFLLWEMAPKP